jgi:hypothetical protein
MDAEEALTPTITAAFSRAGHLIATLHDRDLDAAWRQLAGGVSRALVVGPGPRRAAKLGAVVANLRELEEVIARKLAGLAPSDGH